MKNQCVVGVQILQNFLRLLNEKKRNLSKTRVFVNLFLVKIVLEIC